jgi:hypothetical protein
MAAERVLDPSLIMQIFDDIASDADSAPSDDSSDPQDGSRNTSCALPVPEDVPDINTVKCQQSCTVNVF